MTIDNRFFWVAALILAIISLFAAGIPWLAIAVIVLCIGLLLGK